MKKQPSITVKKDAAVATLTFNRPHVHNALNTETIDATLAAIEDLQCDREVKAVVITGAGHAFIAGADISEMLRKTQPQARRYAALGHSLIRTIASLDKPVIAAINGHCFGGGMEVALACDFRIASDKAEFGLPEALLGIIPGWGATQRAARLLGTAITKELIFTGASMDASRALKTGLINHIVPHDTLIAFTMELAMKICRQSRNALSRAKKVINDGVDTTLPEACQLEIDAFVACFETEDQKEGMSAFLEKRKPDFK